MSGYNVLSCGLVHVSLSDSLLTNCVEVQQETPVADVFRPPLAMPVIAGTRVTQWQAAFHLLCCTETLTRCQQLDHTLKDHSEDKQEALIKRIYSKEDFSVVNRFESNARSLFSLQKYLSSD